MTSYEHKSLIKRIEALDHIPDDPAQYSRWIEAADHLSFLQQNAVQDEVILFAAGPYTYVVSAAVPAERLSPINKPDLLAWSTDPYRSIAGYAWGGGKEGVWIERGFRGFGSETLSNATQLIFGRTFEGWEGPGGSYFEAHQEYSHLSGIHWRPEHQAYCRYDESGDLEKVLSITIKGQNSGVTLVTTKRKPLEEYLAAGNLRLVHLFDFTLLRFDDFSGWSDGVEHVLGTESLLFYRQKIMAGHAAYTRGAHVLSLSNDPLKIQTSIRDGLFGKNEQYVEFVALDWRNNKIAKISTDPQATTNYFEAKDNCLPFEVSPAFFKPEVLSKYKADKDKYTVSTRHIDCRAAWHLKGYDVNEAGQVHVYICDLRNLPYAEQLHWLSFNETPKASISERAYINDIQGDFISYIDPLQKIISLLGEWKRRAVPWWSISDEQLFKRVSIPHTASRDEWAESFMDLAKLVIEGFRLEAIRGELTKRNVVFDKAEKSIALLEKLISDESKVAARLQGLRLVQLIRNKAKGHAGGSEAKQLAIDVLAEHETYAKHFLSVCEAVVKELSLIDSAFSKT